MEIRRNSMFSNQILNLLMRHVFIFRHSQLNFSISFFIWRRVLVCIVKYFNHVLWTRLAYFNKRNSLERNVPYYI